VYSDLIAHGKLVLDLSKRLHDHLKTLPQTVGRVSSRRLKTDLKAEGVASQTWTRTLKKTLEGNLQWIQQGQSLERVAYTSPFPYRE
jgi:hypothetical protein